MKETTVTITLPRALVDEVVTNAETLQELQAGYDKAAASGAAPSSADVYAFRSTYCKADERRNVLKTDLIAAVVAAGKVVLIGGK